jgi:hypothetical protein
MAGIEALFKSKAPETLENTLADDIERLLYDFKIRILRSAAENTAKHIKESIIPAMVYKLQLENQLNTNASLVFKYELGTPYISDEICQLSIYVIVAYKAGGELYKHHIDLQFTINEKKLP